MKSAFIVLSLVAAACGQYNYQQGGGNNGGGFNGGNDGGAFNGGNDGGAFNGGNDGGAFNGGSAGGLGAGSGLGGAFNGGSAGGLGAGSNNGFGSGFDSGSGTSFQSFGPQGGVSAGSNDVGNVAPQAGLSNQFYTYTVDENDFNDDDAQRAAQSVRRAERIVFIKGPSNKGLEDALLSLGQQAAPKTAIYVLNKEAAIGDLADQLNNVNKNSNSQPEVHFVKYRTAEDAVNAQRTIQGQYDALGGNSRNINGGVATILDFASQAAVASTPNNAYLPSSVLRQVRN